MGAKGSTMEYLKLQHHGAKQKLSFKRKFNSVSVISDLATTNGIKALRTRLTSSFVCSIVHLCSILANFHYHNSQVMMAFGFKEIPKINKKETRFWQ